MFILDQKLQQDSFFIGALELSQLRLMNDSNYPWLILIPQKNSLKEITDLDFDDQVLLLQEINFVAQILQQEFDCEKLNIANLGNIVSQLHIHVIVRNKNDCAFPKPVWGTYNASPYNENNSMQIINKISQNLKNFSSFKEQIDSKAFVNSGTKKNTEIQIKKILFRALHRGCKETDFLLGNFFEANKNNLVNFDLKLCEEFLEEDDLKIYDWILKKEPGPNKYSNILNAITQFHNID